MAHNAIEIVSPAAETVFLNGTIITVNSKDEIAEALAVRGRRILRVGDRSYVEQTIAPGTRVVESRRSRHDPGIHRQSYTHDQFTAASVGRLYVLDCTVNCRSCAENYGKGWYDKARKMILGRGFQEARLAERRNPNRFDLDPVSPDNPVSIANREEWDGRLILPDCAESDFKIVLPTLPVVPWTPSGEHGHDSHFPFRSLLKRGIVISGGSDWPVGLYNPLIGLDILVNHRFGPEEKGEVLNSEERLTVLEAIRVYTYNGAFTAF